MYKSHSKTMTAMKTKKSAGKKANKARMMAGTNTSAPKPTYPPA